MKHTWGPEHRNKFRRRVNVCARCGLVREKLWSYSDDGMRMAYRHEDGRLIGTYAPICESNSERKEHDRSADIPRAPEA